MTMLSIIPAYGRDYTSLAKAVADWENGKDFIIADISSRYNGRYVSIRDIPQASISIRYSKLRKQGVYYPK